MVGALEAGKNGARLVDILEGAACGDLGGLAPRYIDCRVVQNKYMKSICRYMNHKYNIHMNPT